MIIQNVKLTPVAIPDVPLVNTKGVHQAVFLRTIIEIETDDGQVGIGESYGGARALNGMRQAANALVGLDPFHLNELRQRVETALPNAGGINAPTMLTQHQVVDAVYSAFEIPLLDIQGKVLNRPLCDLLGGAVRDRVSFGGYLFYKFAKPEQYPGPDLFDEVMTPEALVNEAKSLVKTYGFRSLKLKGGVLEPKLEIETMQALRDEFPDAALRIDPMGAWRVPTAMSICEEIGDILEYLEDPVRGMEAMAELASKTDVPLATNLVVVEFEQVVEAYRNGAVQIILSDHHYWRGATGSIRLGEFCRAGGLGISMHSNTHLGISLAAMIHVAAATPNLTYDCDTHYPWTQSDIITGGKLTIDGGSIKVPEGPGLGVEIDQDALAEFHNLYLSQNLRDREDTDEMLKYIPDYKRVVPRW
ncbi:MAG: enolase C-terminal domain-like protein [Granulosicoccus sp.]